MATKKKTAKTDGKATTKRATTRKTPAQKAAKKAAAPKKEKKAKEPVKIGPRHPRARVLATPQGSKEALAKALAPALTKGDEDTDIVEARLKTASNAQLLRLQRVTDTVKQKYGGREGLIEAIGKRENKAKDKDYLGMLEKLSLPNLLDLATSAERRARA